MDLAVSHSFVPYAWDHHCPSRSPKLILEAQLIHPVRTAPSPCLESGDLASEAHHDIRW